jgi:protein CLEC16A
MSLMLVNINRPSCLAYILSHPFITELINGSSITHLEYYVSVIKTLALRLDPSKIALMYNQKHCRFPLAWEAARFYNHPETLVRASTTSALLALMRGIPSPKIVSNDILSEYFSSFPHNVYYVNVTCSLNYKCRQIDDLLTKGGSEKVLQLL